jgi:hypothetical protein
LNNAASLDIPEWGITKSGREPIVAVIFALYVA